MKHEFAIFIGRFSPVHAGHEAILKKGFELAEKLVIVVGSHNRATNVKNPWSSDDRIKMITSVLSEEEKERVSFVRMKDFVYNDNMWVQAMQAEIAAETKNSKDIALIGFDSDDSSYYLKLFPKWKFYSCPTDYDFHATDIRNKIFHKDNAFKNFVHPNVSEVISDWMKTKEFNRLKDEYDFLIDYKEKWRGAPFTPIFTTVDAAVIKSGHVLLVRRGKNHGKGLLALPGGFLNHDEKIIDGAIRELKEETAIKVSKEELYKHVVNSHVFDSPSRSLRGRSISHAYLINLGIGDLPQVKGSDDADKAFWLPLNEVLQRESEFFEDHFYIIQQFVNKC